ncbi:MAG: putative toxin-antitoxin system toxin component, PIN family [Thermodesulfobacteriota bacterium]
MIYLAVFDTNILFSGSVWKGNPFHCLELARAGQVGGITCQEILDELAEKLAIKLNLSNTQINETITDLLGFIKLVSIPNTLKVISDDPDDDKIIECAIIGRATHIVTGDRRHLLPKGRFQDIEIISATDFLKLFSSVS